jgi:negative regulator of flagellin synthesis FlgM
MPILILENKRDITMVIEKIGNISNTAETKKSKPVSGKKEDFKSDSIQISSEGKQAAEVAKNTQIVKDSPDMRIDRVKDIKMRIENGTYDFNDNKMLEMVADKIASFLLR